jgi:exosortase family protein XrtF
MLKNKPLLRFLLIAFIGYIIWFGVYELWLKRLNIPDFWLTGVVSKNAVYFLNFFGYSFWAEPKWTKYIISDPTGKLLVVSNACNGLILYILFAGFIIATPGKLRHKVIMVLSGFVFIYLLNVARVMILCLIKIYRPEYLDFNHKYTFTVLIYSCIFMFWVLWINRFSGINSQKKTV